MILQEEFMITPALRLITGDELFTILLTCLRVELVVCKNCLNSIKQRLNFARREEKKSVESNLSIRKFVDRDLISLTGTFHRHFSLVRIVKLNKRFYIARGIGNFFFYEA